MKHSSTPHFTNRIVTSLNMASAQGRLRGMRALVVTLFVQESGLREGGGSKASDSQHLRQRLTARERLEFLLDPGSEWLELGLWAGHGMYAEWGGAPAAGVVTGIGVVSGRRVMVIANVAREYTLNDCG
jgi:3-methylcrotonyl-CoA carboxylase beta subunit